MVDGRQTEAVEQVSTATTWRVRLLTLFSLFPWPQFVLVFAALVVLVRLPSHFWLDETMSYWTASRGFGQILARCALWPHPIIYSTLFLALRSMGASSEWIYRLPSFLAVGAATFVLFRMSRRIFGSQAAWMSAAAFVSIDPVRFAAGDARPYGLALLLAVISSDLLLRFQNRPGYRLAALYGFTAAAMLHLQILFGVMLLVHGLYLIYRILEGQRIRLSYAATGAAVLIAVAAPVMIQFMRFTGNPASHSFAAMPSLSELAAAYMPWPGVLGILAILAIVMPTLEWKATNRSDAAFLALLWAMVPPLVFFAISRLTSASLFVTRYFLSYSPGLALCFGIILRSFRPRIVRAAVLSAMALSVALSMGRLTSFRHTLGLGDWGSAAEFINRNVAGDHAPVLIRSQLIESDFMPIEPIEDNGNFPQLAYYPIGAHLVPLQNTFTATQMSSIHTFLEHASTRSTGRFLVVSFTGPSPMAPMLFYIIGQMGPTCTVTRLADFDGVAITEFRFPPR
jgi:Dolichyl-phosphate-mannose-protein mannosyltransferase